MAASHVTTSWGKVNEQLYNDILKEETLPYCVHCHIYGHRTLGCPTRSKPVQPFRPFSSSTTTPSADTFGTASNNSLPSRNEHPQQAAICRDFNRWACRRPNCHFKHICNKPDCGGNHPGFQCPKYPNCNSTHPILTPLLHLSKLPTSLLNQQFVTSLLHNLQWGCHVGYTSPCFARITPNLTSALLHPDTVSAALSKEVSNGRTAGPFQTPPIPNLQCSPLGVVPKKDGTWRTIMDLSFPHGSSMIDYISKDEFSLHYATFDQALSLVARYGKDALMAKLDIKHAFQLCPVHLEDRELLGTHWQGQYYLDLCLPFGMQSSPYLFNRLADAFEWLLKTNYHIQDLMHYMDDYFTINPANSLVCAHNVHTITQVASSLDIPLASNKLEGPTTQLVFLGILIDTTCMETSLPDDKLHELLSELHSWPSCKNVAKENFSP